LESSPPFRLILYWKRVLIDVDGRNIVGWLRSLRMSSNSREG
jgi:hypothetical protein